MKVFLFTTSVSKSILIAVKTQYQPREKQMSHSILPKLPVISSLGLLPFPLWGVHKQSTCLLFAENLNTVKMTEKKGSLVATPLATEIPVLCYFPACAVYDTDLEDSDSEAFTLLLQHVQLGLLIHCNISTEIPNVTVLFWFFNF